MSDVIFTFLPEIWEVDLFPYLFVALTAVGIIGLIFKIIYN